MNRAAIAWLAFVVPLWIVFVLCTHWEPVMHDGWGHFIWHRMNALSFGNVWDFAWGNYLHNNPRLGQTITLLQYTPGPWHSIVTPIAELGLFYLLGALVIGRWPSLRSTDDALLCATLIALVFVSCRSIGAMLFYRPYTGNYLLGLLINVAWLVPFRFYAERVQPLRWWWSPALFVLGVFAGLSNEHTAPAFLVAGLAALVIYWRRGERVVVWAWSGLAGLFGGALALFLAPAQGERYEGLATQQSLIERIVERGLHDNVHIITNLALMLKPLLVWIAIGVIARVRRSGTPQPRSRWLAELLAAAMALAIVCTLLASPKQGDRLYFAPLCLVCAAVAGWVVGQLGRIERLLAVALTSLALAWGCYRLVTTHHRIGPEFDARMAAITSAAKGSVVSVPAYSQPRSRWFFGDDFLGDPARFNIARYSVAYYYELAGVVVDQREATPAADVEP